MVSKAGPGFTSDFRPGCEHCSGYTAFVKSQLVNPVNRNRLWTPFTENEAWRFLAILNYSNVIKLSNWKLYWSKNKLFRSYFAQALLSYRRFYVLKRYTCLYLLSELQSLNLSHAQAKAIDPLYKIRSALCTLLCQFRKWRIAPRHLTIDEQMVKFLVSRYGMVYVTRSYNPQKCSLLVLLYLQAIFLLFRQFLEELPPRIVSPLNSTPPRELREV